MNKSDDKTSLVFVYNADSGLFNTMTDIAHKIFSPDTYSCNLCMITHDNLSMRSEWKNFIEQLDIELAFLHRDEFISRSICELGFFGCGKIQCGVECNT